MQLVMELVSHLELNCPKMGGEAQEGDSLQWSNSSFLVPRFTVLHFIICLLMTSKAQATVMFCAIIVSFPSNLHKNTFYLMANKLFW